MKPGHFRSGSTAIHSRCSRDFRFSNRPFGVKRFQTIHHHCSVDVAHGLVLLFGIGTKALPPWGSKMKWNNLCRGLAGKLAAGSSRSANSPHPSSREGHHSTARWSFSFRCLRPYTRTSLNHQPEAQHPKSSASHKLAGRLPHLCTQLPTYRCNALRRYASRTMITSASPTTGPLRHDDRPFWIGI